mmetsp:Transcript_6348/g.16261  ORF Transcript_6348/g.16261 Transcript_6348/m.16261 type:complete len:289 (+) Transcript_6348:969-1835(+)
MRLLPRRRRRKPLLRRPVPTDGRPRLRLEPLVGHAPPRGGPGAHPAPDQIDEAALHAGQLPHPRARVQDAAARQHCRQCLGLRRGHRRRQLLLCPPRRQGLGRRPRALLGRRRAPRRHGLHRQGRRAQLGPLLLQVDVRHAVGGGVLPGRPEPPPHKRGAPLPPRRDPPAGVLLLHRGREQGAGTPRRQRRGAGHRGARRPLPRQHRAAWGLQVQHQRGAPAQRAGRQGAQLQPDVVPDGGRQRPVPRELPQDPHHPRVHPLPPQRARAGRQVRLPPLCHVRGLAGGL